MQNDLSLAQEGHLLCGEECIFQQKNAAIHNASVTKKYLLEQKIKLLDPPQACFPDFSPIENWRGLIVAKVYEEGQQCSVISELKTAIFDAWENPISPTSKVSMPSRIFEVIKPRGGNLQNIDLKNCLYILWFCSLVLYLCHDKILKLSINANIHVKNKLNFLHILNLFIIMPCLSYIWFS